MSSLKKKLKSNPELKWNNLNENQKSYFKIMYVWLRDKDAYQKILSKDSSILTNKRFRNSCSSSTPKIEKKSNIESM
jgi:hypothetical protein